MEINIKYREQYSYKDNIEIRVLEVGHRYTIALYHTKADKWQYTDIFFDTLSKGIDYVWGILSKKEDLS